MDLDITTVLVVGLAVLVGSFVQSSVGLGAGLVAAPVVTLADPRLMPGALIIVGIALAVLTLRGQGRNVDRTGVTWALIGRLPGTVVGVAVVAWLPAQRIGLAVGGALLVAVVLSWRSVTPAKSRRSLLLAGAVSGVAGTAAGVGGPPLGLVYAHERGPVVRSTLAVYFLVGGVLSLVSLAVAGQLEARSVLAGACALPFVVAGSLASRRTAHWLDTGRLRHAILAVTAASSLALLAKNLL